MYSGEDLERFYFQYQAKALPHGESVQSFCLRKKVPYNIFQKWYKDMRNKILEVKIDSLPSVASPAPQSSEPACPFDTPVRIWVEILMSNGLRLSQKNLSYWDLVRVVEKLEGLC